VLKCQEMERKEWNSISHWQCCRS